MNLPLRLLDLREAAFERHSFHTSPRAFAETNCYVDLWIAVLHALGLDAAACLGCGLASGFEGDQWTFVKPAHGDLERLYGVGVEELSLWRDVLQHVESQVAMGRVPLVELDAFYLPDAQGTDYRHAHVKTTVGITHVDRAQRALRYFHNAGFYGLRGEDFDGLFRHDRETPHDYLPPYCEFIKLDRVRALPMDELQQLARKLTRHHFNKRPQHNPIARYAEHMQEHMQWIVEGDEAAYHRYGFSALRQLGSAFEISAEHMRWLARGEPGDARMAAECFDRIAAGAKRVLLKLARVSHSKRATDVSANFAEMAAAWEQGMHLAARVLQP